MLEGTLDGRDPKRMNSAWGGPNSQRSESLPIPTDPEFKGESPASTTNLKATLEERGIAVDESELDELGADRPHVGPTAGGG